ncbi:MAG: pilus assembly protein [Dorea sp.]|nr:pilus assembly protein [Dorea sp.]
MKKHTLKASFTVEMSVIAPVIMMVMMMTILTVFYEHDKNIISAAAYETAVVGSGKCRTNKEIDCAQLQSLCRERIGKKCILSGSTSIQVSVTNREVSVQGSFGHKRMRISVMQKAVITKPESYIRKKKRW